MTQPSLDIKQGKPLLHDRRILDATTHLPLAWPMWARRALLRVRVSCVHWSAPGYRMWTLTFGLTIPPCWLPCQRAGGPPPPVCSTSGRVDGVSGHLDRKGVWVFARYPPCKRHRLPPVCHPRNTAG